MAKDYTIAYLLDLYGAALTDKQRTLVDYYYNEDLSLSEISENEGITRQGARDGIKRAEAQLKEWEEKLGLLKKRREQTAAADRICGAVAELLRMLEDGEEQKEMRRLLNAIAETAGQWRSAVPALETGSGTEG